MNDDRRWSIKIDRSSFGASKIQIAPVGANLATVASRIDRGVDVGGDRCAGNNLVDSIMLDFRMLSDINENAQILDTFQHVSFIVFIPNPLAEPR